MSLEQALIEGVKVRLSKCLCANAAIELRRGAQKLTGERLKFVWTKFSTLSWGVFVISVISGHKQARPHLELKIQYSGLYYKCSMIVIYDHNDSGQCYKTTIKIIIDDST
jgi:hypothetical protein